jgi:hypothetical protein
MKRLIATIGHSIVRIADGTWIPSGLYQAVENGPNGRIIRTFVHQPDLDPNAPNAYLGGGQAVVKALFKLWREDERADIAIIGGRPRQMDTLFGAEVLAITEASVMAEYFHLLAHEAQVNPPFVRVIGGTRTTEDDMRELLQLARDYEQTTVIAMSFRLFRARLSMKFAVTDRDIADVAERVIFCDAEQFLPEMLDDFVAMNQSAAYARTMVKERSGVRELLAGGTDYPRTA